MESGQRQLSPKQIFDFVMMSIGLVFFVIMLVFSINHLNSPEYVSGKNKVAGSQLFGTFPQFNLRDGPRYQKSTSIRATTSSVSVVTAESKQSTASESTQNLDVKNANDTTQEVKAEAQPNKVNTKAGVSATTTAAIKTKPSSRD